MARADRLGLPRERAALFASYLTDDGLAELGELLDSRRYEVRLPEDAVLLTVAALVRCGERARAWEILDAVLPFADRLRFMPRAAAPRRCRPNSSIAAPRGRSPGRFGG